MKKLAFIYNSKAGRGNIGDSLSEIIDVLSDENDVTVMPTKRKGHLGEYIVAKGNDFDTIVIAGGDGTVNEAFNALMTLEKAERPALGYIPLGTTNDFASSCRLPHDYRKAAKIAVGDKYRSIDAGKFNNKYFAYIAAFGVFTSAAYETDTQWKNMFGYAAYVMEGIKSLATVKPCKMLVEVNGERIEDEFIFGMVANSSSVGGMKLDKLNIDLSDGLFEVILIKKIKSLPVTGLINDLKNGKTDSKYYYCFKSNNIRITSYDRVPWTLDGEYGGDPNRVIIENFGEAIKIKIEE